MKVDIWIPLKWKGNLVGWTVVDELDKDLARFTWKLQPATKEGWGYARRSTYVRDLGRRSIVMHREILGLKFGDPRQGDHIDRNRLNNRRSNLRICTHAQNRQNRSVVPGSASRYRGVQKDKNNKWKAVVVLNNTHHNLGSFNTELEAAKVAKNFRLKYMAYSGDKR